MLPLIGRSRTPTYAARSRLHKTIMDMILREVWKKLKPSLTLSRNLSSWSRWSLITNQPSRYDPKEIHSLFHRSTIQNLQLVHLDSPRGRCSTLAAEEPPKELFQKPRLSESRKSNSHMWNAEEDGWSLRAESGWQPARKQGLQSYNHKGLNSKYLTEWKFFFLRASRKECSLPKTLILALRDPKQRTHLSLPALLA